MKLRSHRVTNSVPPGSTGLYDLPPELLDWVVSYADAVDLLNLSLVCKSLNKLVTSHLYSEYVNTNLQYRRPVSTFLLHVANDPNLAHHVRHVELGVWNTKLVYLHPGFRRDVSPLPDDQFTHLADAAKQSGLIRPDRDYSDLRPIKKNNELWGELGSAYDSDGYTSDDLNEQGSDFDSDYSMPPPRPKPHSDVEFLRCLQRGLEDPQVILMLAKLPRLQELSIRGPHMSQGLPWDTLCSHSLKSLTKLKLAGNSSDSSWDIAELNAVIQIPSLRELHGYLATSDEWDEIISRSLQIEPQSLSLTHIYFERCALGNKTIKNIIEGCKALESFSYVAGGRYVGYEQFRAKEVKEHLLKHKNTLKYLALDLSHWDFPRNFTSFKSMTDFIALEKVIFDYGTLRWRPSRFFTQVANGEDNEDDEDDGNIHLANTQPPLPDLLPKSLRELVIFQAPPVIVENLVAFETSRHDQHPHLKSIKIHTSRRRVAKVEEHKRLPELFKEKGIEYSEPPIDLQFPIPQMHDWIMDPKIRRMMRWNPKEKKYQSFNSRPGYRRFCEDVLHENPTRNGGSLDPSMNFAYGFEDDLISYLDDQFEFDDDLSDSEEHDSDVDSEVDSAFAVEEQALLEQEMLEFDDFMHTHIHGLPAADLNADLNNDEEFDSEISSDDSYMSPTDYDDFDDDDYFYHADSVASSVDSAGSQNPSGITETMAYYEWDYWY